MAIRRPKLVHPNSVTLQVSLSFPQKKVPCVGFACPLPVVLRLVVLVALV